MTTDEMRQLASALRAKAKKMDRLAQETTKLAALLESAITEHMTTTHEEAINEHRDRRAA